MMSDPAHSTLWPNLFMCCLLEFGVDENALGKKISLDAKMTSFAIESKGFFLFTRNITS